MREAQTVLIYYGSFQGDGSILPKHLGRRKQLFPVKYPEELENWKQLQGRQGFLFTPDGKGSASLWVPVDIWAGKGIGTAL